ncbi:hypothetical protein LMG29542_07859 [Paraburkholderia humisilvae]|uniref:Helix-turn-helix domain-containing protein n=3 Tax=Paraburkholderia humisilvae TaxID=627669 RepID=A0A6J5FA05_9BURK|nr:hypothetical protein LMG29542_07859 [Paraburkholderia humisilvae]
MVTPASRRTSQGRTRPKAPGAGKSLAMPGIDEHLLNRVRSVVCGLSEHLILTLQAEPGLHITDSEWGRLAEVLPPALTTAFVKQFLGAGTSPRKHRALLTHLLAIAELQSLGVPVYATGTPFVPEQTSEAMAADTGDLTSEEAAKLLHVSRTHLNALIDEGKLPSSRTKRGHRRIPRTAVLAYREQTRAVQRQGLVLMTEASERLGLYDDELAGIPVRRKER